MLRSSNAGPGPEPQRSEAEAIRAFLEERCSRVAELLHRIRQARGEAPPQIIHDLRVAIRRAAAALQLFHDWLPRRRSRTLQQSLRKLRKSAGQVRDLDVLNQFLSHVQAELPDSEGHPVEQRLAQRRRRACRKVARLARRTSRHRFRGAAKSICRRVRWRGTGPEPTWGELLNACLAPTDWLASGTRQLHGNRDEDIHALRIHCRKLRYQLEILAVATTPPSHDLSALVDALRTTQDRLGDIHDAAMQRNLLKAWSQAEPKGSKHLQVIKSYLAKLRRRSTAAVRRRAIRPISQARALIARLQRRRQDSSRNTKTER